MDDRPTRLADSYRFFSPGDSDRRITMKRDVPAYPKVKNSTIDDGDNDDYDDYCYCPFYP